LATIDGENGLWTLDRRGDYPTYGQRETGLCQFHPRYNSHIINDPRFSDYRFQVEQCWEKFSANPNLFNAYKNGLYKKQKKHFTLTEK
jgi:hypothetical protein